MSTHTEPIPGHAGGHPDGHPNGHEDTHDHEGVFLRTLIALLILTAITVAASYVDFGSGNVVIALFIASIKAALVALFFMHLRYDKPVDAVIAVAGFLFLGIFLMFCLLDFDSRVNLQPVNVHPLLQNPQPPAAAGPPANEKK
jgi:cytochrome c oxidase subunit IV